MQLAGLACASGCRLLSSMNCWMHSQSLTRLNQNGQRNDNKDKTCVHTLTRLRLKMHDKYTSSLIHPLTPPADQRHVQAVLSPSHGGDHARARPGTRNSHEHGTALLWRTLGHHSKPMRRLHTRLFSDTRGVSCLISSLACPLPVMAAAGYLRYSANL